MLNLDSEDKKIVKLVAGVTVIILAILTFFLSVRFIEEGERGVVTRFSKFDRILPPGLNFVIPYVESVSTRYNVRILRGDITVESAGGDSLRVEANVDIQWRLQSDKLPEIFRTYGTGQQLSERLTNPVQQKIKEVMSAYEVEEMIPNRDKMAETLLAKLKGIEAQYHVVFENAVFSNLKLPPSLVASIEEKKVAFQKKEAEEFRLEQQELQAQQAVNTANAEAEAIQIKSEAQAAANILLAKSLTPNLLQNKWIDQWNGIMPRVVTGGDTSLLLGIGDDK